MKKYYLILLLLTIFRPFFLNEIFASGEIEKNPLQSVINDFYSVGNFSSLYSEIGDGIKKDLQSLFLAIQGVKFPRFNRDFPSFSAGGSELSSIQLEYTISTDDRNPYYLKYSFPRSNDNYNRISNAASWFNNQIFSIKRQLSIKSMERIEDAVTLFDEQIQGSEGSAIPSICTNSMNDIRKKLLLFKKKKYHLKCTEYTVEGMNSIKEIVTSFNEQIQESKKSAILSKCINRMNEIEDAVTSFNQQIQKLAFAASSSENKIVALYYFSVIAVDYNGTGYLVDIVTKKVYKVAHNGNLKVLNKTPVILSDDELSQIKSIADMLAVYSNDMNTFNEIDFMDKKKNLYRKLKNIIELNSSQPESFRPASREDRDNISQVPDNAGASLLEEFNNAFGNKNDKMRIEKLKNALKDNNTPMNPNDLPQLKLFLSDGEILKMIFSDSALLEKIILFGGGPILEILLEKAERMKDMLAKFLDYDTPKAVSIFFNVYAKNKKLQKIILVMLNEKINKEIFVRHLSELLGRKELKKSKMNKELLSSLWDTQINDEDLFRIASIIIDEIYLFNTFYQIIHKAKMNGLSLSNNYLIIIGYAKGLLPSIAKNHKNQMKWRSMLLKLNNDFPMILPIPMEVKNERFSPQDPYKLQR